ncbi:type IV toxin-antitoxin system AbiEi family antitoxin domain-containing protein [Jatrophihabitans fulvus]
MRPLPTAAADQFGVFTTAQAIAGGWTSSALRHAVATDRLVRPRAGTYATPPETDVDRLRQDAAAFSLCNPGVPLTGSAAGAVMGAHLLTVPDHVCAVWPRERRGPMPGVHRHRGRLRRTDLARAGRVRLTAPARTVFAIGHEHGEDSAIVAADSASRRGLVDAGPLWAVHEATRGWPGSAAARRALVEADAAAESPLESISRLRMIDAGLPTPHLQPPITTRGGVFLGRPDFYWEHAGVIGEADGMVKYDGVVGSLVAEKKR